ncbi:MAG: hypothetical protein DME24_05850 [Verrucomicrobia bacterium]|nr:MAG: hypothetical protein DME24_05850 [Verrucomicrobiota bacterium]
MPDEAANRSARKAHSGDDSGGRGDEHSPLQARAAFIQNWSWEFVVSFNRGACERGRSQHGHNQEPHQKVRDEWQETRHQTLTLLETLDFLFRCHRAAPFLFFNSNTFAEIARRLVDVLFADLPLARRHDAASLAAHYVAGVLDRDSMTGGIEALSEAADFRPGDRVRTLKGSRKGVVRRILTDGRIAWLPDGNKAELIALPESLLHER